MSTEQDKFKRSQRIFKQDNAVKKQVDIAKSHGVPADVPNKFAKRHAMNCGNPDCHMCSNPRKVFNELSIQEKKMFQDMDDHNNDRL
jgi:hypothetical protein